MRRGNFLANGPNKEEIQFLRVNFRIKMGTKQYVSVERNVNRVALSKTLIRDDFRRKEYFCKYIPRNVYGI